MPRTLRFIYTIFLAIIATSGCKTVTPPEKITILKTGERLIAACILNDASFPIEENIINETLDEVFREYRTFANIIFQREPTLIFYADITAQPIEEYVSKVWRDCKEVQGIKIVFSNRMLTVAHFPSIKNHEFPPDTKQAGVASKQWGIVLLYSATEQWYERDLKGNPTLITTLNHEIGHCFDLEHVSDNKSFMYAPTYSSFGQWTSDAIADIKKNYRKIWHRP